MGIDDRAGDTGAWLVAHRAEMDRGEAGWLLALARFDLDAGWYADGQLSCAEWLMWHTRMARATAFEKLRVARQLHDRPVIAEAFSAGRLSYSAVRVITRIDSPDPDVDTALIDLAEAGTVSDLERAVRVYQRYADQERPLPDPTSRRAVRIVRHHDGTGEIQVTLTDIEVEEFAAALQAFLDLQNNPTGRDHNPGDPAAVDQSPHEDSTDRVAAAGQSSRGDSPDSAWVQSPRADWPDSASTANLQAPAARRADALMDLIRVAVAHAGATAAAGDDRYLVHLIQTDSGPTTLLDGTPIDKTSAAVVACDTSTVAHHHNHQGEPLYLGRRHRTWNTAQRRAALIRDGGHCRFPGCRRQIADLHHQHPWSTGGPTNLDNGFLACPRHHTLLHQGFQAQGNPNHTLTFYRPDGTPIGRTRPIRPLVSAGCHQS